MKKERFYYMVNVTGKYGYSFMVHSKYCLNENEVLELSRELFENTEDLHYASVDDCVTEYDVAHFEEISCLFNID